MIKPIAPTQTKMLLPRKQHAMLKIDHKKYSVLTEFSGEIQVSDLDTAWELVHQIKTGKIYNDVA